VVTLRSPPIRSTPSSELLDRRISTKLFRAEARDAAAVHRFQQTCAAVPANALRATRTDECACEWDDTAIPFSSRMGSGVGIDNRTLTMPASRQASIAAR
jgi:hypothetical protein